MMGLTASLDMGSEKMAMALASTDATACHLKGIKIIAAQGIDHGIIKSKEKAKACVRSLMSELIKDGIVDVINVALPGSVLRVEEKKVPVSVQRKAVEPSDLYRAEQRCIEAYGEGKEELVDVIPVGYAVDRGELLADPVGVSGRTLEATFQVYLGDRGYLSGLRSLFDSAVIGEVAFYPVVRAYAGALDAKRADRDFALVDLGAMGMNVALFRDGMLEYEVYLPLGVRTIDTDIMAAYALDFAQARKLKHDCGQALRGNCKDRKLPIPDTRLTLGSKDLATVVQSRSEELLEGVIFQLQRWGFDDPEDPILSTGGGSRLQDIDVLFHRMSGHPVERVAARGIQVQREETLRTPEYLVALGLLLCGRQEQENASSVKKRIADMVKGIFGI